MFTIIYQGIIIVLLLAFSFGPAFFGLINTSIKYGFRAGAALAIGVFLSDFLMAIGVCFLVHYGAEDFLQDKKNETFIGILGGVVLIVFGVLYLIKKEAAKTDSEIKVRVPHPVLLGLKGFFLNIFNPIVWPLWLANVAIAEKLFKPADETISSNNGNVLNNMIFFFSFTLIGVLACDLLKVYVANKIKKYLTFRLMKIVNWITGISLMSIGFFLIYKFFFLSHGRF
ncbi:MAG: LysE family transporter [Bacteroidia bacterium]|nr:LysE family transporter [Bacteroidia bacterium]